MSKLPPSLPPIHADPDFRSVIGLGTIRPSLEAGKYRRMVFNPFLGFLGVGLWWQGLRQAQVAMRSGQGWLWLGLLALALASVWYLPRLFRYHCLDCGQGGAAWRWKDHLCPRVVRRIAAGEPARPRPPGPWVQAVVWVYVLALMIAWCRD